MYHLEDNITQALNLCRQLGAYVQHPRRKLIKVVEKQEGVSDPIEFFNLPTYEEGEVLPEAGPRPLNDDRAVVGAIQAFRWDMQLIYANRPHGYYDRYLAVAHEQGPGGVADFGFNRRGGAGMPPSRKLI